MEKKSRFYCYLIATGSVAAAFLVSIWNGLRKLAVPSSGMTFDSL